MNLIRESSWYALYTRPRSEKKAAETLSTKGITVYCPIQKTRKQWHDRVKTVEEPVFKSYIFVQIRHDQRAAVLSDPNIINFVLHCGKPAVIRDQEIATVRAFLEEYVGYAFTLSEVSENDPVRISVGPFANYSGIVVRKMKRKASIRLELFNAYLVAEFKDTQYCKV